jgi:hypothetical protein
MNSSHTDGRIMSSIWVNAHARPADSGRNGDEETKRQKPEQNIGHDESLGPCLRLSLCGATVTVLKGALQVSR